MDTQIKVIREFCTYNDEVRYTDEILLDINIETSQFSFREEDNLFLKFVFDESKYSVEYEDYETGEFRQAISNVSIHFSTGRDDLGTYFPGYFQLRFVSNGNYKYSMFFVEPGKLEYQNVIELRKYVDSFYYGLSQDFLKTRKLADKDVDGSQNGNIYSQVSFVMNEFPKLMSYIVGYHRMYYVELNKKNVITHTISNFGSESVKWLSKKGMSYNENIYSPDTIMIKKAHLQLDNLQNQIFKSELMFWNHELQKQYKVYNTYCNEINKQILNKEIEFKNKEIQQKRIENERFVANHLKKKAKNELVYLRNSIDDECKALETYKLIASKLRHYKTNVEYLLYNTWLKGISDIKQRNVRITDSRLLMLSRFREEYRIIQNNVLSKYKNGEYFSFKSTPKLFETFTYIALIKIMLSIGFRFTDSENYDNENLIYKLSNESVLKLYKDELRCEIVYDKELKKSNSDFLNSDFCYINTSHNKPDFMVSVFKEASSKPLASVIVEDKWRSKSNIFNDVDDTEVVLTLKDYYQFGFMELKQDKHKLHRGVISKVIVLYPDKEQDALTEIDTDIYGIGLYPSDSFEQSQGFNDLKSQIIETFEDYINLEDH
ncbi:hypothetical protein DWY01_10450 [Eubacterium sp. AF22-8LB]|uniref:hypothetical protein n=1 Tax=Eubacterium sp. AF22-8LB TaxID=2292232 RepID=UPI000E501020|nr:hypothetical protein [Eubacterium sp. AF22-8LB]RGS29087.1 hypothetical protein DWY01_10450 [Eubacterium sp. AF22-8LB]